LKVSSTSPAWLGRAGAAKPIQSSCQPVSSVGKLTRPKLFGSSKPEAMRQRRETVEHPYGCHQDVDGSNPLSDETTKKCPYLDGAERARLHTDQAGRLLLEERQHLSPPQLSADNHGTLSINAVDLKYILRKIDTNRDTSFMDGSCFPVVNRNHNFGTLRCRWAGAVHRINFCPSDHRTSTAAIPSRAAEIGFSPPSVVVCGYSELSRKEP